MNQNISRRSFIKGMAASAIGAAAFGTFSSPVSAHAEGASLRYIPGTYTSVQTTPYASVEIKCTFSEDALTDVSYEVLKTSQADYFTPFANPLKGYCSRIVEAGTAEGVDGVTGASLSSNAIRDGVNACRVQALGLTVPTAQAASVLNPQEEGFDTCSGDLSNVFSPIQLGTMTLRNRVIKSAGSGSWADSNKDGVTVATELYGTMARNGVALILFPGGVVRRFGVTPESADMEGWSEEVLATSAPLVGAIHDGGGKVGVQFCYGGGAPTVPDSVINDTPIEEIEAWIEGPLAVAAERCKKAGFDCIEIKGASADALNGFLTRRVNRREDEYGSQNTENRTRLFRRMIERIKEVNGADYPVGALINGVEENDVSLGANELFLTIEESREIAKALVEAGADWIQVRVGANGREMNIWAPDVQHMVKDADGITGYGTTFDYSQHFEGMVDGSHSGFASFLPMVKAIKEVVDVPVGCAAYMDLRVGPDYLNKAIADGELDLVYMNRPLNCDPELVSKMEEGRREDVIPCMKCMHCHDSVSTNRMYKSSCRMNAAWTNAMTDVMPEGFKPLPAETPRKIMVIGGGPAGMEAARVAAERGHSVSLYDNSDKLGGLMHFARGVKGDHERFDDYFTYITHQLEKNNVEIHLFKNVDAALVKEQSPDAVIVAVGGKRESKLTGTEKTPVFSPSQAFGSESKLGNTVVIVDAGVQAVDFAAYLVTMGKKVVIVHSSPAEDIDKGQSGWFKTYMIPYLQAKGTKIWSNAKSLSVEDDGVRFVTDAGFEKTVSCDSVVDFTTVKNTALAEELEAAGFEVHTVGDCADPHNIQRAVLSGNLTGRQI